MAKREIPEINAGSMADIAFLLLIFFLVTTTMDKDVAYIRPIPKKLEDGPPPPPIEKRNICEIKANDRNDLLFRGVAMSDPDKISEKVVEFYRKNEGLSQSQTTANIQNPGYLGHGFPFYSFVTMDEINENIRKEEALLDAADEAGQDELIDYHDRAIREWQAKKKALTGLKQDILKEIHPQAHIRIEVQQQTKYELFAKIQSEVEEALYELRDDAALKYFNESYGVIKNRRAQDKSDANNDQEKLDVLEVLYPARIIEVKPS